MHGLPKKKPGKLLFPLSTTAKKKKTKQNVTDGMQIFILWQKIKRSYIQEMREWYNGQDCNKICKKKLKKDKSILKMDGRKIYL